MSSSVPFIPGLTLCEAFFHEIAEPLLMRHFPGLPYSAGLLGYGSDVLGYDDAVSTDHMWGPRFYLFLDEAGMTRREEIQRVFATNFPYTYRGFSVHFSEPDENDHGVRHPERICSGEVSPLVFFHTFEGYLDAYLGTHTLEQLDISDWLSFSEHRLLALTCGKFFTDGLELCRKLEVLSYYPQSVRLYLLASNWSLIAQEQAFVRRCADVGDETGSILVCARIAQRLMRLAFLYCGRYSPYSKWFGTAVSQLPFPETIGEEIRQALTAQDKYQRETALIKAQEYLARLNNSSGLTPPVEVKVEPYFNRDILVIHAEKIAESIKKQLFGTPLSGIPLIGSLSEIGNYTEISDDPAFRMHIRNLYLKRV